MNEELFLKKFAKALGAEQKLKEIEQKKIQQEKMLKGMAKLLGTESLLEEIETKKANEQALIDEKREKERKMIEQMNAALARLVSNNPEHAEIIQKEVEETIVAVQEEEIVAVATVEEEEKIVAITTVEEEEKIVAENASQPQPELPNQFISAVVKDITKNSPTLPSGEPTIPDPFRRELDLIKKSIVDLHRFASNHSQHGGGGEVKLARLDDVDATTIADGLYLRYDSANNMFVFDTPAGGGGSSSNGISITNATVNGDGFLIITYSNSVSANAGYVIGPNGPNGISVTNAVVNGNGSLIITYSNSVSANAGYVVGPAGANGTGGGASITVNQPGYVSGPMTGQSRFYPSVNTSITSISASVSEAVVSANVQFKVFKNGADTGPTYSINIGNYQLISTAASIDLTTSDYLTLNMVAGTAFDLRVNFK